MVFVETMKGDDDEQLTFVSLAALTANVVRYLQRRRNVDEQEDQAGDNAANSEENSAKSVVKNRAPA